MGEAAARHRGCPPAALGRAAGGSDHAVRNAAAANPATPPAALVGLADDSDRIVRLAAAMNPASPPAALETAAASHLSQMRVAAAANENTPAAALRKLAGDEDYHVRGAAAANPEAAAHLGANPLEVRRSTAKHKVGSAAAGGSRIRLSAHDDGKGMVLPVMVHEMSHIVHGQLPADRFQQPHGAEFAAVYVDLAALVCGDGAAERLRAGFADNKVEVADSARRVRGAGGGLIAAGRLPRPSRDRDGDTVRAARAARTARGAEKRAAKIVGTRVERPHMDRHFRTNREYYERAARAGAELPAAGSPCRSPAAGAPARPGTAGHCG